MLAKRRVTGTGSGRPSRRATWAAQPSSADESRPPENPTRHGGLSSARNSESSRVARAERADAGAAPSWPSSLPKSTQLATSSGLRPLRLHVRHEACQGQKAFAGLVHQRPVSPTAEVPRRQHRELEQRSGVRGGSPHPDVADQPRQAFRGRAGVAAAARWSTPGRSSPAAAALRRRAAGGPPSIARACPRRRARCRCPAAARCHAADPRTAAPRTPHRSRSPGCRR